MTTLFAKPIVDGKFWIIEQNGIRVGTLLKKENNRFILSSQNGESVFGRKEDIIKAFGKNFFKNKVKTTISMSDAYEVNGYPTSCRPHNPIYDVQQKLHLFTKSKASKNIFCAGYFIIRFNKGWVKSFCPKLSTIERYESRGPFKTEVEVKQELANARLN